MDLTYDVPCILNDVSVEDTYEGDFSTRRALIWNLNFTMKGFIFGPTSTTGTIRRNEIKFFADTTASTGAEQLSQQPALTTDGKPTTNNAISVPLDQIEPDDDFGISSNISEI